MVIDKITNVELKNKIDDSVALRFDAEEAQKIHISASKAISSSGLFINPQNTIEHRITSFTDGDFSEETYEKIFAKIAEKFNRIPTIQHKCHNCGATVEIDMDKHIFVCKHCGSVYAIGTAHVNDLG